jgi:protein SCO1/2
MKEDDFAKEVDRIRQDPKGGSALTAFLMEQHRVYSDKSANAVVRMRGYVLYSFSFTGLSDEHLPYITDELENGRDAYLVGAAALALRHLHENEKSRDLARILLHALHNIINYDSFFSFDYYYQRYPLSNKTSAVKEVIQTLAWLGSYATAVVEELESITILSEQNNAALKHVIEGIKNDKNPVKKCCEVSKEEWSKSYKGKGLKKIRFEDHSGKKGTFAEIFNGKVTLVAFFYSRCDNPLKCSLTISNLAVIQQQLEQYKPIDIQLIAITYDPVYDQPNILKLYAEKRGLQLDGNASVLRTIDPVGELQAILNLGVNYVGDVVNRHAIELYIIDRDGAVKKTFSREKMNNEVIITSLLHVENSSRHPTRFFKLKSTLKTMVSAVTPVFIILLPKCPFCFAAYLSIFGLAGSRFMPLFRYLLPALLLITAVNIFVLYRMARIRKHFLSVYLCGAGSALVILSSQLDNLKLLFIPGFILLGIGALANSLPVFIVQRFTSRISLYLKKG